MVDTQWMCSDRMNQTQSMTKATPPKGWCLEEEISSHCDWSTRKDFVENVGLEKPSKED